MAVSGFPLKASMIGVRSDNDAWFVRTIEFISVVNNGGSTEITFAEPHGLSVNDTIVIYSDDLGQTYNVRANVDSISSNLVIISDASFNGDASGLVSDLTDPTPIDFSSDTPANMLREIHLQITTNQGLSVDMSVDGGVNFAPIDNNLLTQGFRIEVKFVQNDTLLQFQATSGAISAPVTMLVGTE